MSEITNPKLEAEDIAKIKGSLPIIEGFAKKYMEPDDLHGIGHVLRVIKTIKQICKELKIDSTIPEAIGWLHDVGRKFEDEQERSHAEISFELAKELLQALNLKQQTIDHIENAILSHSFSLGVDPNSLDALVLRDADRLDALGAVGIFRVCTFIHTNKQSLSSIIIHCDEKLLKLKDSLETEAGRKIGEERHNMIKTYRDWLENELGEGN
jgi:uncharacterized protein